MIDAQAVRLICWLVGGITILQLGIGTFLVATGAWPVAWACTATIGFGFGIIITCRYSIRRTTPG